MRQLYKLPGYPKGYFLPREMEGGGLLFVLTFTYQKCNMCLLVRMRNILM